MLSDAVNPIHDQFPALSRSGLFARANNPELILHAATGEAGAELLRQGHRPPIGPGSINGAAAAGRHRRPTRAKARFSWPIRFCRTPSREIAIPMIFEDNVGGTLNLQSDVPTVWRHRAWKPFSLLAAQLATAVENARLFTEITHAREQMSRQAQADA